MNEHKRHILLCVVGMTPQIITETLYVLTQEHGEHIDEVRVITTLAGRNRVMQDLLSPGTGKFFEFCREYGIDEKRLRFDETCISLLHTSDGSTLDDIRTVADNESAANWICKIVRQLTNDPGTRLHVSAAGGRKTMAIYLTAAMQMFGRSDDRLSHVLVSEDFEGHTEFYYIPREPRELLVKDRQGTVIKSINTSDARIHLADIPFVRLRGVLADWLRDSYSYGDFVRKAQEDLDLLESAHDLTLDANTKSITVGTRTAKLSEAEFFYYTLFAYYRKEHRGEDGFVAPEEITVKDLDTVLRAITAARGNKCSIDSYDSARFDFVLASAEQIKSRNKKDKTDLKKSLTQIRSKMNNKIEAASLPERYQLVTQGERGSIRYGLNIAPERIRLFE